MNEDLWSIMKYKSTDSEDTLKEGYTIVGKLSPNKERIGVISGGWNHDTTIYTYRPNNPEYTLIAEGTREELTKTYPEYLL